MATLKQIKGSAIQFLDEDPVVNVGSWASAATGNNARTATQGFGASYSASVAVGGLNPSTTSVAFTETYNGSAWTEVNDLPAGKGDHGSAGTQTAAFAATGFQPYSSTPTANFDWDGTNWTAGGATNTGRYGLGAAGTQTAGMIAGGYVGGYSNTVELYNGSSWTETTELNTGRSL